MTGKYECPFCNGKMKKVSQQPDGKIHYWCDNCGLVIIDRETLGSVHGVIASLK